MKKHQQVDLEALELFPDDESAHLLPEEGEDAFHKFFTDWQYDIDSQGLAESLADSHQRIDSHYTKIAQDAEAATPKVTTLTDATILRKRFSQPDPRAPYREYFRARVSKGQSAADALEEWRRMFEHINPDVESLMVEVAKEFS